MNHALGVIRAALLSSLVLLPACGPTAAQQTTGTSPHAVVQGAAGQPAPLTRAQRRAQRRAARAAAVQKTAPQASTISPDAERLRDQKLLVEQKNESAKMARENDAVTQKALRDQQQVQAEPRIQDAPGPGSQPLPGEPAVQPAPAADPPRIQDAPGPAQTLPKTPPAASPQS